MIFAPNTSGALHIGSACVLWLTAKRAMRDKCKLYIRYDDRGILCGEHTEQQRDDTIGSTREACAALNIHPDEEYFYSERVADYTSAVDVLSFNGHIRKESAHACVLKDSNYVREINYGTLRDPYNVVLWKGYPNNTVASVVDFYEFNVPIHVRATDLMPEHFVEAKLAWLLYGDRAVANPVRAYIPVVCNEWHMPLHKSQDYDSSYSLREFCKKFPGPETLRNALETIVLDVVPGDLSNIRRWSTVSVSPQGVALCGTPMEIMDQGVV